MKRPELPPRPLTIAEAAKYLGYRTTAGIRGLVKKKLLTPCGRGARDQHLFDLEELDLFKRNRGLAYAARQREFHPKSGCSSPAVKRLARRKEMITMRQENGTKTKYPGIYSLSDGTFRIVAKAVDSKTGRARFKERYTREVDPAMTQNAAVAYRSELINKIKTDLTASGTPTRIPRLETLCRSSWITFVTENVNSEDRAAKLSRVIETHILKRWGSYFIDKITVPEIDAWVRDLTTNYSPETIGHHVGLFRRILGKARGQYQLIPIDWDLITLPTVTNGLLFPSEAGTRPVGNDQLNDVWREVQVLAGIDRPVTVHGIRHSFHDLARQQGVPDAVVKAMAGRSGAELALRGQDKHLHYSRDVTVEEMRQASMALMQLVPSGPVAGPKSRDEGRDESGRGRDSDDELAVSIGP